MKTIALATIAALALTGTAFAKAHDQGVADGGRTPGDPNPGGAAAVIDALTDAGVLDGNGVSAIVKGGARGAEASGGKGGK